MKLSLENGKCGYRGRAVIDGVSIHVETGEVVGILGRNGAGKTTVFRSMLGLLRLLDGQRLLNDTPVDAYSAREFARLVACVPQGHETAFSFPVPEVVVMGRAAYLRPFEQPGEKDHEIAERVMEQMGIGHLRGSNFDQISGGEKRMALIARALAQEPRILLLDEPTAGLDLGNQIKVLSRLRALADGGMGVLMTTHDPDHVLLCCDRAILITPDGSILQGGVNDIVTEENLRRAYGVRVRIIREHGPDGNEFRCCVPMLDESPIARKPKR